jgi:CubicO group peptidase (beta-lactamase class C family)
MRLDNAARWVQNHVDGGRLSSAVLAWTDVTGPEEITAFGPVGEDARFALYSVTKPLVALAAVRAIERGELSLRARLADAVPGFGAAHSGEVTLEHLLSHTAGLIEPRLDDPRALRALLRSAPQQFEPGRATRYSSLAFEGVAALLEHHTERGIESHVEELLRTADATGISFDRADAQPVDRIDEVGVDFETFVSHRHPGAGLFGDAADLLKVGRAVLEVMQGRGDGILHPTSLASMLRPRTVGLPEPVPAGERREFGLGWQLLPGSSVLDDSGFGHGGWAGSQWWFHPTAGACAVLLTSVAEPPRWGIDMDEFRNAVAAQLPWLPGDGG